jgi:hypothetical protein
MQQFIDARHLNLRERPGVRACPELMSKTRDKEHQLSRFVARVRGAVTEIHPSCAQRPRAPLNGGANALDGANFCGADYSGALFACALFGCADGFDGGVG